MPLQRYYCMNCADSVYNKKVGTRRIPLVFYFVLGQPDDTGERLNVMDPDIKVPSFVREFFHPELPNQPVELCIPCVAELFGLKMYTPGDDPMHSAEQLRDTSNALKAIKEKPQDDAVERRREIFRRVLMGIKVGRGAMKAPKLPKPDPNLRAQLVPRVPPNLAAVPVDNSVARAITVRSAAKTAGKQRNRTRKARARPQVKHVSVPGTDSAAKGT